MGAKERPSCRPFGYWIAERHLQSECAEGTDILGPTVVGETEPAQSAESRVDDGTLETQNDPVVLARRDWLSDYSHWIIPTFEDREYAPDVDDVTGIVSSLRHAGWIKAEATEGDNWSPPSYYGTFPGCSNFANLVKNDPRYDLSLTDRVIRASHCQSISVMVTDTPLVAPVVEARAICQRCGQALVVFTDPDVSQRASERCAWCKGSIAAQQLSGLPVFRFAVVIELWFPPARDDLTVDSDLLGLLRKETGRSFREARQLPA